MRVGVDYARHDVLFFVDGDMFNLTDEHIESLSVRCSAMSAT